jgi:hypothetical protein
MVALTTVQVPPQRACDLCQHGITVAGTRQCTQREVVQPAAMRPVELMRRPQGPCGPDAAHLDFPGLRA